MYYYSLYMDRCNFLLDRENKDYTLLNDYENFKDLMKLEDFKEIMRWKNARKNKRYRVDSKFMEMLRLYNALNKENSTPYIVFGTLTLRDDILAKKEDTYIRKIHKYLEKHYQYVILNKDFGKKTEREHYHFIGLTCEPIVKTDIRSKKGNQIYQLKKQDYELGFEPDICIINIEDKKKVREYLLKLNNHSNKNTTKQSRIRIILNPWIKVFFTKKKAY